MDSEEKNRVTIEIYGTAYKFVGQSSTNHIRMVAALVDDHMNKIAVSFPQLDTARLAVLAAVNIADDNFKLKEEWDKERKSQENHSEMASYRNLQAVNEQLKKGHKQKEESLMEDYRKLMDEHASLKDELKAINDRLAEDGEHSVHEEYAKLQEEYKKLQNEYNEWIELTERDQPRQN